MLCDSCHKNDATCHVCRRVDGLSQSMHLCMECFEANSPEMRSFLAAYREAHCEYCDAQPCAGGADVLALATGAAKLKFMCMPCSIEHNSYLQEQLARLPAELSQHEQLD